MWAIRPSLKIFLLCDHKGITVTIIYEEKHAFQCRTYIPTLQRFRSITLQPEGFPDVNSQTRVMTKAPPTLAAFLKGWVFTCAMVVSADIRCYCVSVCPSVTSQHSTETAKHRIMHSTQHDSPGTLVFWRQKSQQNLNGVTPNGGAKCRWGRLNATEIA